MNQVDAPAQPVDKSLRMILFPELISKMVLGGRAHFSQDEVTIAFEGDGVRVCTEDFKVIQKVSQLVRKKMKGSLTKSAIIQVVLISQQLLAEEIFKPNARRVLFYSTIAQASAFYRCVMPHLALGQGTGCTSNVTTGKFTRAAFEYDVIVFQISHSASAYQFAKSLKDAGKKIVFEIDDAYDRLESWHPAYTSFGTPERQESIKNMMRLADAVQVSTQWLADHYKHDCQRVEVIPNLLELSAWPVAPKLRNDGRFTVVWAGSSSHSGDLREVLPALSRFARVNPDVKVVFFGQELRETEIPTEQMENVPWCEFVDYPFTLANIDADVSIAPLAPIPFNLGKSNLRILQMWATGYPVVASSFGPYADTIENGSDGLLCTSEQDWFDALQFLYKEKEKAKKYIANGMESVKRFDLHPNIQRIESFYMSL